MIVKENPDRKTVLLLQYYCSMVLSVYDQDILLTYYLMQMTRAILKQ